LAFEKFAQFYANFTRGLRRRWLRGTVIIALAAVVVVVAMFALIIYNYYFATIRTGLEAKARTATDFFANYVARSYDDFYDSAFRYAATFREADRIEMQFLNSDGSIMISSSAMASGTSPGSPDILEAIDTRRISTWVGRRSPTGERIMAASAPMIYADGEVIGVMRYVTSLRLVDRQVFLNILVVLGVGSIVLGMVFLLNLIFVRFIITPVSEITKMSKRIAEGSYGIQINNAYRDEIGDMVESINEMSLKIAQTEKIQTEFISSISHELRTPLTAITGWGETLSYNEELDNDSKRGIAIMLTEARRLTKMVEELLEFTMIEDGRFTLHISEIDIAAELEDAIFTFRELLHQDELEFDYHHDLYDTIFIRFIITPVSEITKMSKRIADGSYGIQINNEYRDEIGDMVESINEMSLKIAQTEKIQTEFISSISHELRTPLTAITGWGETLFYNDELDKESKRGVAIMLKEARRLTKMVEELLEFTMIEDGRFTLNIAQIDISAELEDAIFTFRELLHQDELEFDYHHDIYETVMIPGDSNRLKQVFLNIFDNALKYGRDGKRIEVYIGLIEEHIVITIRDYGPGVAEDELENLKMKFYKGSNSKERGSGIGLAVCEEIIKYHGGSMELSNADRGGFLVTIILPASDSIVE